MAKSKDDPKPAVDASLSLADRRKASKQAVIQAVLKKYGDRSIGSGTSLTHCAIPRLSSGVFVLDYALGGGWPMHRINLIWGAKATRKTGMVLATVALAQKMDALTRKYIWELSEKELENAVPMSAAWLDFEGVFDRAWSERYGVDVAALDYSRPRTAEEGAEILEALVKSGSSDVVVVDSLAMMTPKSEAEGEMTDQQVGVAGRINSKMFRKIQRALNEVYQSEPEIAPTVFIINQVRQKVGVMWGSPEIKPGGVAQDFVSSVVIRANGGKVEFYDKQSKLPKCAEFGFRVDFNKVSPPRIEGEYTMALVDDPDGEFKATEILDWKQVVEFAEKLSFLTKDGAKFQMYGEKFNTKTELLEKYIKDPKRFTVLKRDLLALLCPKQ